jgi:hypothetical protein
MLYLQLSTRTKEAKEVAGKLTSDFKEKLQRNRMARNAAQNTNEGKGSKPFAYQNLSVM